MKPISVKYPFVPKSNRSLIPGQFWAIPLHNGKFACGRVIEVHPFETKMFLAGLMDWIGELIPNENDLTGKQTIKQGQIHIKAIYETALNKEILGYRNLYLDNIESYFFKSQDGYQLESSKLMKGYKEIRSLTKVESDIYPTFSTWGYDVIRILAEELSLSKKI
ncbi:immunity 26/phosphotriesterase HocA family protein [Leptospira noguchii]|uniref:immunity 26/phosphotriesterase HocA family protein n=1 Tax=Leptospira noguchii TaxID=28182 RepID=UPI000328452E|nr:immunity 26/phosphotriesterase HocA family protein [Leptospira noguchii]EMS86672.1 hypothetical protein LEP1GSC073_1211 [Leptospira noguchii str. Cascata]